MKYFLLILLLTCLSINVFSQKKPKKAKKPKVVYVLPTIVENDTPPPPSVILTEPNEMAETTISDAGNEGNAPVAGEAFDEAEAIRKFNQPIDRSRYSEPVKKDLAAIDAFCIKYLGENDYKMYVRFSKERIDLMEDLYKRQGDKFDEGGMGFFMYSSVIYQNRILDVFSFPVSKGEIVENYRSKLAEELKAYKVLFEGKLSVSPDDAMRITFGDRKPYDYSIHLRTTKSTSGDLKVPADNSYKRPKIYWYIWENACTRCQEAEIDANNPNNFYKEMITRKW